jgi:hypothetical protein
MRFGVAIATAGRADVLASTLVHIKATLRDGDTLVVVGAAQEDWPAPEARDGIDLLLSPKGSTLQRNAAIDHLTGKVDVIVFFDDDFMPRADWLDQAERLLRAHPDIIAFTGRVVADGISGPGMSPQDGARALEAHIPDTSDEMRLEENIPSYGCNMGFRAEAIGSERFDIRLRLYAWQEDADFSCRVARTGRRVRAGSLLGVHLGVKAGRMPGKRLGYAQIANPVYLMRKGTMRPVEALALMARNVAANLAKSLRPESWVDRRGRLIGNLRAFADLCQGRMDPERVEQL